MDRLQCALAAVLGLVAGACATRADVVATGKTSTSVSDAAGDGTFGRLPGRCYAGLYEGTFSNSPDPNEPSLILASGFIRFSLIQSNSGEYYTVDTGAQLAGTSDQGYAFTADIDTRVDGGGGGCREGEFSVVLANGRFYTPGTDANAGYKFYGNVDGSYNAEHQNFDGKWKAYLNPGDTSPISQGRWQAMLHCQGTACGANQ
jgi:hypothetical protein